MASDWSFCKVGDIANIQGGYAFKSKDFIDTGIPVIKIKNVRKRDIDLSDVARVSKEVADSASNYFVKSWDVLISMTGSGPNAPASIVGRIARHSGKDNLFLLNQRVGRFVIRDTERLDQRFLYYLFSPEEMQLKLLAIATGSANQVNISGKQIESIEVNLPPPPEQKVIAHILGSLDDKIELNRQMNKTLEAMAQALFKSWFVDFDPVLDNALAAGNPIPDELLARAKQRQALPPSDTDNQAIRALFPDAFEFTEEMGWIPRGWEVASLGKHMKFQTGPAFKSAEFTKTGVKLARGDNVKEGRFQWGSKTRYWSHVEESLKKYLLKSGDVLIGMDGSKVGKNRTRVTESDLPCLLVQRVARLSKKNTICSNFIFLVVNSQYFRDYVDIIKTGSAIPHISGGQIKDLKIVLPKKNDNPIFDKFEGFSSSFINRIDSNIYESKTLAKLRDTLLPKLLSGELRITDAAAMVEDA